MAEGVAEHSPPRFLEMLHEYELAHSRRGGSGDDTEKEDDAELTAQDDAAFKSLQDGTGDWDEAPLHASDSNPSQGVTYGFEEQEDDEKTLSPRHSLLRASDVQRSIVYPVCLLLLLCLLYWCCCYAYSTATLKIFWFFLDLD